ncbi:unnamed protein product [Penicillium salamii]|uniref:Uncharacterized protein n=1 Tax=Penicillium salamii TaxID=1612424 RepID=A0A9W4JF05_9EURO|nr:unnamed protein product [Penicillium salamii]
MGVGRLEEELLNVFSGVYLFQVESYVVPLVGSGFELIAHLSDWYKKHHGENILRIIIYSGHAASAGTTSNHWDLAGRADYNGRLQGPKLDWWPIRSMLNDSDYVADTCFIFDCCSAESLALGGSDGDELIAAAGWNSTASTDIR